MVFRTLSHGYLGFIKIIKIIKILGLSSTQGKTVCFWLWVVNRYVDKRTLFIIRPEKLPFLKFFYV